MLNPASKASLDQALSTPMGMYVLADVCVLVCAQQGPAVKAQASVRGKGA